MVGMTDPLQRGLYCGGPSSTEIDKMKRKYGESFVKALRKLLKEDLGVKK